MDNRPSKEELLIKYLMAEEDGQDFIQWQKKHNQEAAPPISPEFHQRIQKELHSNKFRSPVIRRNWKRAIAVMVTVVVCLSVSAVAVVPKIYNFCVGKQSNAVVISNEFITPEEVYIDASNVAQPSFLPKGFTLATAEQTVSVTTLVYQNPAGDSITYQQYPDESLLFLSREPEDIETKIDIAGQTGILIEKANLTMLAWGMAPRYFLSGSISKDLLIQVAESVPID